MKLQKYTTKFILSAGCLALLSFTVMSCGENIRQQDSEYIQRSNAEVKQVIALHQDNAKSPERGVSKGVIEQNYIVSVYAKLPYYVTASYAKEGVRVNKGDLLFQLDTEEIDNHISKLKVQLSEREMALREILIGQGYSWEDTLRIPRKKLEYAKIKSGYNAAFHDLHLALQQKCKTKVYAPASGFVEEVKVFQHDLVNPSVPCCRIVNTDRLKVVFYVLETELNSIQLHHTVQISPIVHPQQQYAARIYRIIPRVNADGMVKVKAVLTEEAGLIPGMNVYVNL